LQKSKQILANYYSEVKNLNKVIIATIIIFIVFSAGCQTTSQSDREILKEMEKMQQRIDELESEVEKVESKHNNTNTNNSSTQYTPPVVSICYSCNGFGAVRCDYCRGTGNSKSVCYICDGAGHDGGLACFRCGGSGFGVCPFCLGNGGVLCNSCGGTGKN
jgi:outer membrane murein-binding lipoprotein Lpp